MKKTTTQIKSIIIVSGLDSDWTACPRLGEISGPWDSEDAAVEEGLLDGQRYEVHGNLIFAEAIAAE